MLSKKDMNILTWEKTLDTFVQDFLSTVSSGDSGAAALDSIAELEQMVGADLSSLERNPSFNANDKKRHNCP